MATITSTASGNFNATATWVGGVVPVDGDSFVIAAGHTVTYNVASPVTNGFNDSSIYGILQSASGTSTILRMNGRLNIRGGGTYHARAGHKLQFKGTAAESHILYLYEEASAALIMEGSDGMPTTTLSANANERATSFSVASAANFAAGEWIAVYNNTTTQAGNGGSTTLQDEGFWIHDVSGTTIYFRQYVGPESTISASSGSTITVANAKVFRVGQILIFGTGANRNILTVTGINYTTNVITFDSAVTGTVTGLTVYETGTDKIHASGNKVRKVATVTTASSAAAATTITVANANMFTAGDEIWIEARSECGGTTDGNYNQYASYMATVSSVSSNTITLNAGLAYNVVSGALVTRLTRDVIVEPVTPNTDYYGVWGGYYVTNYGRKLILKDVYFRYNGSSTGQPEGGVSTRGYYSTNSPAVTLTNTVPAWSQQPWIEGLSLLGSNSTRDWGGLWMFDTRYGQLRCCTVVGIYNSSFGLYYNSGTAAYNCIGAGSNAWGFRVEGITEWGELAYNYMSRGYYGTRIANSDSNCGYHHNRVDAFIEGGLYTFSCSNIPFYKWYVTGGLYGLQWNQNNVIANYSVFRPRSGYDNSLAATPSTYQRGFYYTQVDRGAPDYNFTSNEDNFEYNRVKQYSYGTERWWDSAESAWRVVNSIELSDYGIGWFTSVYIPPNVSLRTSCDVKLYPGFSGTYPYFEVRSQQSGVTPNQLGNAGGQWSSVLSGGYSATQYTSAGLTDYETKEIYLAPVAFPRFVNVGVHVASTDASEGYWMRPIVINLDTPYSVAAIGYINRGSGSGSYGVGTGASSGQIRLGGGRI